MRKKYVLISTILVSFLCFKYIVENVLRSSSEEKKFIWPGKQSYQNSNSRSPSKPSAASRSKTNHSSDSDHFSVTSHLKNSILDKMPDIAQMVDGKIAGKKVMMFSKSGCPFCTKAKKVLQKYLGNLLSEDDYEVMEIERNPDCQKIQDYLNKKTGGRSVPRVFVKGKFIGGGDDVVAKDKSGELKKLLA